MKTLSRWCGQLLLIVLLAACAHVARQRPDTDAGQFWSGRLALQVEESASQSFSASFELKGSAEQGELSFFNPLGGTVARMVWQPGSAALHTNGEVRAFDSLEALVEQATGAPLPLVALFDWLHGNNTPIAGWQADLSHLSDGKLTAVRHLPTPVATLRVALDR